MSSGNGFSLLYEIFLPLCACVEELHEVELLPHVMCTKVEIRDESGKYNNKRKSMINVI